MVRHSERECAGQRRTRERIIDAPLRDALRRAERGKDRERPPRLRRKRQSRPVRDCGRAELRPEENRLLPSRGAVGEQLVECGRIDAGSDREDRLPEYRET